MTDHPVPLPILYQDDILIAVNKPRSMLVHPGKTPEPKDQIAMKVLRDQLGGHYVYPAHRLDRPTSGVLLFTLTQEHEAHVKRQFATQQIDKEYLTLVYGTTPQTWTCNQPLTKNETEPPRQSTTHYRRLAEYPSMNPHHPITLLQARPQTGRMHQIRKHLAHDKYKLLGDYLYGDHHLNAAFATWTGTKRLMLHSHTLELTHPTTNQRLRITAPPPQTFTPTPLQQTT